MVLLLAQIAWVLLLSMLYIPTPISSQCTNQYVMETGAQGEDIWRSASGQCFIPQQATAFGTIKVGKEM